MIRGYFHSGRSYVNIPVDMPDLGILGMDVRFMIDTGAGRTIIGHRDAIRMAGFYGIDLTELPMGGQSLGIGGLASTRQTRVVIRMGDLYLDRAFPILEPIPGRIVGFPSLLGQDILSHFALFMEERTERVLLLEPDEADSLDIG